MFPGHFSALKSGVWIMLVVMISL